jgi:hypothetical protein
MVVIVFSSSFYFKKLPLALRERAGVRESQTLPTGFVSLALGPMLNEVGAALRGKSLTPAPLPEGEGIKAPRNNCPFAKMDGQE